MFYLYRYITYQTNTKVFDKEFQLEVTDDIIEDLIDIFTNIHYLYYLLRSKAFLDNQDMISWKYTLTEKVFDDVQEPYMIVAHKDIDGNQNIDVFPRYYKNTRNLKITPNLHDLANLDLLNNKLGVSPYSKKPLYRNCLRKIIAPIQPLTVGNIQALEPPC